MATPLSADLTLSQELRQIFDQANHMALAARTSLNTTHLLICLYTTESTACALLRERGVRLEQLSQLSRTTLIEHGRVMDTVLDRLERTGKRSPQHELTSLHLLATLMSEPRAQAYRALDAAGLNLMSAHQEVVDRIQVMNLDEPRQLLQRRSTPQEGVYALS